MEGNTNSISECLAQMINLTKKNLAILKANNEAFYTKRNHIPVMVDGETYVIPSFISLESRIESLEQNLQNLLDAPLTGEAFTYFNGTTQRMELSGYSTTPEHVDLAAVNTFSVETNNIFKDFMSPNPFVKMDIQSIPNNIKHAVVRKVAITETSTGLIGALNAITNNGVINYADAEKILYGYEEGTDYTSYDTTRRLPIRKGVAQGDYEIADIIDNYTDKLFDEYYELQLDRDLVYYINNGTIQKDLEIGDCLVTWNDKVMMEIVNLNTVKRTIKVKILHGAYANLQDKTSGNPTLYKLKYFADQKDIDLTKYIEVPLEEDRYVMIFISPVNDTTNTMAPWGDGVFLDVDSLTMDIDGTTMTFRQYYDAYVNNVGDSLVAITSMMDDEQQVGRPTRVQFEDLKNFKPTIDGDLIKVTQINKHLNDTKSIQTIRNLYDQKNQYKVELDTVQRSIDQINKMLSELSFDDTTNSRTVYETQLSEYNSRKSELTDSINHIMQEIAMNANNSDTPIENAKYHIRGFVPTTLTNLPAYVEVIKMDVEYRYKNKSSFTGNAETFEAGDGSNYIFSDWNKMESIYRRKLPEYVNNILTYKWESDNGNTNNPSYNQIDIPITQGEIVDIRVRFIYSLGYPFVEMRSDWSTIYTQEFPVEYTKNVEILDIIAENNDEIKSHHFENILAEKGVTTHIEDELQDQTILYMHKAESITSGFLTEERRVIPLGTKLKDFNSDIENLKSEVFGAASTNLIVTLSDANNAIQLKPGIINNLHTTSFNTAKNNGSVINFGTEANPAVAALSQLNITFYNNGSYDMRLHSLFPGAYGQALNPADTCLFPITEYATDEQKVYMMTDEVVAGNQYTEQMYNQFMYFRRILTDVANTPVLYQNGPIDINAAIAAAIVGNDNITSGVPDNKLLGNQYNIVETLNSTDTASLAAAMRGAPQDSRFGFLYPYPGSLSAISAASGDTFMVLGPGESISMPVNFVYWFASPSGSTKITVYNVTRMMAFDVRTSLYQNPITYKFTVNASYEDTISFELLKSTSGINVATMQRLVPSTPVTVARNASDWLRNMKVTTTVPARLRK